MKPTRKKAIFNWSGGKDSALALYHVLKNNEYEINRLITTTNSKYNRISMHGVRNELLFAQGESLGLPIHEIRLPEMPSMEVYDQTMSQQLSQLKNEGISHSIFGDIFLEDLKNYRDQKLKEAGLMGNYPLWKRDTTKLIHEFIDLGFKTIIVCIKANLLPKEFAGRVIDRDFLKDLPKDVDPCGENGEFHTFVYDGPIFKKPISFTKGDVVYKTYDSPKQKEDICHADESLPEIPLGFYFQDLLLVE